MESGHLEGLRQSGRDVHLAIRSLSQIGCF
jgi:hypothetical protein